MALVSRDQLTLTRSPELSSTGIPQKRADLPDLDLSLQPLRTQTYNNVQDGNKPFEIELPPGMPRYVNVRTLKEMLGARPQDRFLRKVGHRWEICPDSYRVDRLNRTEIFMWGKVQIFS